MTEKPLVSVIVPTKNSARTLEACLVSCRAQSVPVQIVVVDNHSSDSTPEIARRHADILLMQGPERSAQRNAGVQAASGEFVAIIDSDMVLEPTVIQECLAAISGAAGVVIPERSFGDGFWSRAKALERSFYVGVSWMEAARFFRRADFLEVGGYDVSLTGPEDWEFSQRMSARGRLVSAKAWINHDEGSLRLSDTLRKKFYYALGFAGYKRDTRYRSDSRRQSSIFGRYRLFFSDYRRLFAEPVLGCGMLFMKTCEFVVVAVGYVIGRLRHHATLRREGVSV
jgi:glycosyltransferase involved in cell wall biosynthesis